MKHLTNKPSVTIIALACTLGLLSGCTKSPEKISKSTTPQAANQPANTPTVQGQGTQTTTTAQPAQKTGGNQLPGQVKINLNELPGNFTICTIGQKIVTAGDYRRQLQLQQEQMQANIVGDPLIRTQLLSMAKQNGIMLTEQEEHKLIEQAKAQQLNGGKDFANFLKERHMSEAEFNKQITEVGLIYKVANIVLEQGLLNQLVSRTLLCQAAIDAGLENKAVNQYIIVKHSRTYDVMKKQTGLSEDVLKDEIIKDELSRMMIEKIAKGIKVTDAEIKQAYDKNKQMFKHDERIRLSVIVVAAPDQDQGSTPSLTTMVKRNNPKMSGAEVNNTVARLKVQQQQKALLFLSEVNHGVNFAKLANQNSDDARTHAVQNGGDMGFLEKQALAPEFVSAVWNLKAGQVLQKLVKTPLGFQIIKVTARQGAGYVSLSEVKPMIEAKIKQDKLQQALAAWVEQQKRSVKIEFSKQFLSLAKGTPDAAKKN